MGKQSMMAGRTCHKHIIINHGIRTLHVEYLVVFYDDTEREGSSNVAERLVMMVRSSIRRRVMRRRPRWSGRASFRSAYRFCH